MSQDKATQTLYQHLESLTKAELIQLIIKFAPESFRTTIHSRVATEEEARIIFKQTSKLIANLFTDEELLYDPDEFERELIHQLEKLRGLWETLPLEIGNLLITLIQKVERAFDDGYLYLETYGGEDEYFESEVVNAYIFQFVTSLAEENQRQYIEQLQDLLAVAGYSTFLSLERSLAEL